MLLEDEKLAIDESQRIAEHEAIRQGRCHRFRCGSRGSEQSFVWITNKVVYYHSREACVPIEQQRIVSD